MKKISILLALCALAFTELLWASAIATSVTGTVQVVTGTAPGRALRQGDQVNQGDTVSTGSASSVVLKFDDGQVAALTANSRMTVTAYQFNAQTGRGNVLLSLIGGGMRALTGLIGKNSPDRVTYRAGTATIGIRGTDATIVTAGGSVLVSVTDGAISFTFNNQTIVIPAGQAIHLRPDGTFSRGAINQIQSQLSGTPLGQEILNALGGLVGLTNAINQAAPGTPRSGDPQPGTGPTTGPTPGSPGGPSGGGAGGGAPSKS
ncbi:MAG: FecR family protein [Pseudomonadota bacterium]|nr:FecR family protein [Pseudomonadota bacterium]